MIKTYESFEELAEAMRAGDGMLHAYNCFWNRYAEDGTSCQAWQFGVMAFAEWLDHIGVKVEIPDKAEDFYEFTAKKRDVQAERDRAEAARLAALAASPPPAKDFDDLFSRSGPVPTPIDIAMANAIVDPLIYADPRSEPMIGSYGVDELPKLIAQALAKQRESLLKDENE